MTEPLTTTLLRLIHSTDGATLRDLMPYLDASEVQVRRAATALRHRRLVEPHAIVPTGRAPTVLVGGSAARVLAFILRRRDDGIPTRANEVALGLSMAPGTVRNALATLRRVLAVYPDDALVLTTEGRELARSLSREGSNARDLLETVVSFPGLSMLEAAAELHAPIDVVEAQAEQLRARGLVAPERLESVTTSPLRWPRVSGPSHVVLLAVCRAWEAGTPLGPRDLCIRLAWTRDTLGYSLAELRREGALRPQVLVPTALGVRTASTPVRRSAA